MTDYDALRTVMVDTQIRPSDVTSFPIISTMLAVPREAFVPDSLRHAAYIGEHLDLGQGRVMLDPRTLAKMLEVIDVQPDELVLDIGCALGYSSAVLSRLAGAVVAVEEDPEMAAEARTRLSENGADNVILHEGPLTGGAPENGPFDAIIVEGGVAHLPDGLSDQLKDGGRMVCLFMDGALGTVRIGYRIDGRMTWRFAFNASAPVLPGFERHSAFML